LILGPGDCRHQEDQCPRELVEILQRNSLCEDGVRYARIITMSLLLKKKKEEEEQVLT
jgi:hypothetical protein